VILYAAFRDESGRSSGRLRERVAAVGVRGGRLQAVDAKDGQRLRDDFHVRVSAFRRKSLARPNSATARHERFTVRFVPIKCLR